jgi:hypothetical protein
VTTDDGGYRATAVAALADRAYDRAAAEYTRAGRHVLTGPREGLSPFDDDEKGWVGQGLAYLATATVAERVAGREDRGAHRALEGAAVARDLGTRLSRPVQRACLEEFVADFRAVGGLSGVDDAYEDAEAAYRDLEVSEPRYWSTTPLFEAAAAPIKQVARGPADGEIAVTWEDLHGSDPSNPGAFLAARARYKRQRLRSLVESVLEAGALAAPRGTTEYDNATYRCPACGSRDVNWVAESILCLRCSTPVEEA